MQTVYLLCAAIGGTLLVVQTILLAVGAGADADSDVGPDDLHGGDVAHDASHDGHGHAADSFLRLFSFKTLVAFITFFGLGGLASRQGGFQPVPTLLVAVGAGAVALYLVAYLMSAMAKLQSRGNLELRNAVGQSGKVYLRIPGERSGHGKVTVAVQGRRVECKAITAGPEIPTGAHVRIVGTTTADTIEVVPEGAQKE